MTNNLKFITIQKCHAYGVDKRGQSIYYSTLSPTDFNSQLITRYLGLNGFIFHNYEPITMNLFLLFFECCTPYHIPYHITPTRPTNYRPSMLA